MRLLSIPPNGSPTFSKLTLSLVTTQEELWEVQRLRYKIFIEAMGLSALKNSEGLDRDEFDEYCDHLIVRDSKNHKIVGTYRILGPRAAAKIGRYYSEDEFDLTRLSHLRNRIAEAGRACIHPDYRNGGVIMLLWAGLAAYTQKEGCDYLIGCASISLSDGGNNAVALYHSLNETQFSPIEYRVQPHFPFPIHEREQALAPQIPPLLKGYLRCGAWVCGEPAWDPVFHSADLFVMMSIKNLNARYIRHDIKEEQAA